MTHYSDLLHALRLLRKTPGFTAVAVLTLALGIGANSAIFSVVNTVLLRPLPLRDPDRLVWISASDPLRSAAGIPFSVPAYETLRDGARVLSPVAATCGERITLTRRGDPQQLTAARVSPNFFDVVGVRPALGRGFDRAEGEPGGNPVVLLSHSLWERRFAADPRVLGQSIVLAETPYTVIGIMPPDFPFPYPDTDVWITRVLDFPNLTQEQIRHGGGFLMGLARLAPGATLEQGQAEAAILHRRYREQHPGNPDAGPSSTLYVAPLRETLVTGVRGTILLLTGAVALVLLVACGNVAGLLLARSTARAREIAIRAALGAGRGVLIRQLLAESVLLSLAGAALGIGLAEWGVFALVRFDARLLADFPHIQVDAPVLVFTAAVSLLTGIVFGLIPAFHASHPDLAGVLREGAWGTTSGARRHRLRGILVAAQMALSVVLLIGAGLLVESFWRLHNVNPGFDPARALTMNVSLPAAAYPDDPRRTAFVRDVLARLEALPGVRSATASVGLPMAIGVMAPFLAEGQPIVSIGERPLGEWKAITPAYFATMGIPLLRGRAFTWNDGSDAPRRVIVSQALAHRFWGAADPIGKRLVYARREFSAEVVGVAGDVKERGLDSNAGLVYYTPYPQFTWPNLAVTIRAAGDPRPLANAARAQITAVDADLPVTHVQTLEEFVAENLSERRQTMYLLAGFAAVAAVLSLLGLYAAMAYSVAQRTTEIGIRQAVGASGADILRLVLAQSLRVAAAGIAAGILGALVLTRLLSRMLFHVSRTDPFTYAAIALLFLVVALAATVFPAWRAARVDPLRALTGR
jgi:putative ABC transport system permease protein